MGGQPSKTVKEYVIHAGNVDYIFSKYYLKRVVYTRDRDVLMKVREEFYDRVLDMGEHSKILENGDWKEIVVRKACGKIALLTVYKDCDHFQYYAVDIWFPKPDIWRPERWIYKLKRR